MPDLKLTDSAVEKIEHTIAGTVWYFDPDLRGFQLAVGKRTKTFYVTKVLDGRNVRTKLGHHPLVKAKAAREAALGVLGQISRGQDPRNKRNDTLRNVLADYIRVYTHASHKRLSKSTADQYVRVLEKHCSDWLDTDMGSIRKAAVRKRHEAMRDQPYAANKMLRILGMMFKHAIDRKEFSITNSARGIAFYREHTRETKIDDWREWYLEVQRLPIVRKNYYLLAALTGIRRSNLAALEWRQVDLAGQTVKLENIKNGSSPTLPISNYAVELLAELKAYDGRWVFPADSKTGHLAEPKDKVRGRIHDLRRMFTTAAGQCLLPEYVIARLRGDIGKQTVVQGYMDNVAGAEATNRIGEHLRRAWNQVN